MDEIQDRIPSVFTISLIQGLAGVFLFIALVQRHLEMTLFTALLQTLGARLWACFSPRNISCRTSVDQARLFPGNRLNLLLEIGNHKLLPVRLSADLALDAQLRLQDTNANNAAFVEHFFWYQQVQLQRQLKALRRGVFRVGVSRLQASGFFGFYPRPVPAGYPDLEIIVYPRLVSLKPFDLQRKDFFWKARRKKSG